MLKRFAHLTLLLAIVLAVQLFTAVPMVSASELKDLANCSDYSRASVERLYANGVISGDPNGYFNPQSPVTRGEMVTIIVQALDPSEASIPTAAQFNDVPLSHWASPYVETAFEKGVVAGVSADTFGVDDTCTREQMASMFVGCLKALDPDFGANQLPSADLSIYTDNDRVSSWAKNKIGFALYSGLLYGVDSYVIGPLQTATREQAAVLVDRLITRQETILTDWYATKLLEIASANILDAESFANTSSVNSKYVLWAPWQESSDHFEVKLNSIDQIAWPSLYSKFSAQVEGSEQFPIVSEEMYLVDNIFWHLGADASGWHSHGVMSPSQQAQMATELAGALSDITMVELEAHQRGKCTIEETTVNGTPGFKITYTANFESLSEFTGGPLYPVLSQNSVPGSAPFKELINSTTNSFYPSGSYVQTFYISALDGRLYGTSLNGKVYNQRQTINSNLMPVKSIDITSSSQDYVYNSIVITKPDYVVIN